MSKKRKINYEWQLFWRVLYLICMSLGALTSVASVALIAESTRSDLAANTAAKIELIDVASSGHKPFPLHIYPYFQSLATEKERITVSYALKYNSLTFNTLAGYPDNGLLQAAGTLPCAGNDTWWLNDLWGEVTPTNNYRGIILFDNNLNTSTFPGCLFPKSASETLVITFHALLNPKTGPYTTIAFTTSNLTAVEITNYSNNFNKNQTNPLYPPGFQQSVLFLSPETLQFAAMTQATYQRKNENNVQRFISMASIGQHPVNTTNFTKANFHVSLTWDRDIYQATTEEDKISTVTISAILLSCVSSVILTLSLFMDLFEEEARSDGRSTVVIWKKMKKRAQKGQPPRGQKLKKKVTQKLLAVLDEQP